MNLMIKLFVLFVLFSCCKDKKVTPNEPVPAFDNKLAVTWKLESVTNSAGIITTNPTDKEILTVFEKDTNALSFNNNGSMGGGTYALKSGSGIKISIIRGDKGGWPNGPWLDLYLENMNKASSYQIANNQLKVKTSENNTILFAKQ